MDRTRFAIGDKVEWWSSFATKRGEVFAVLSPGAIPADVGIKIDGAGSPRDHESYVVSAVTVANTNLGGRVGKRGVYWPRVSALKAAPAEPAP